MGEAQGVFMFMTSMCWLRAQRAGGDVGKILRKDESMMKIFHALSGLQKFFVVIDGTAIEYERQKWKGVLQLVVVLSHAQLFPRRIYFSEMFQ